MIISKPLTDLPSQGKLSTYLMLLALMLGVCQERGFSFDEGILAPIIPAINTAKKAIDDAKKIADEIAAAERKAKKTVDSAGNLPSINNATREGAKATAGTVQTGLKGRMKFVSFLGGSIPPGTGLDWLGLGRGSNVWEYNLEDLEKEERKLIKRYASFKSEIEKKKKEMASHHDEGAYWMAPAGLYIYERKRSIEELNSEIPLMDNQLTMVQNLIILTKDRDALRNRRDELEKEKEKLLSDKDLEKIDNELEEIDDDLERIKEQMNDNDGGWHRWRQYSRQSSVTIGRPDPSPSLVRYFQFMGDLHVDYRVALGMSEGREETIDLAEWMAASYLDTNAGHPFAMIVGPSILASGVSEITVVVPSGEISSGKDVAVEAAPVSVLPENWEFFVTGSFGRYDQDRLTGALDGFQSDTWTGTLGLEYQIDPSLMVGIAYSYAETDTTVEGGQGDIDLTGSVISVYAVKSWNALSSGLLYSYGSYENDVSRSTGIGNSQGNADSDSNTISWMLDYALVRSENLMMGPSLDLDYGEGSVDGYSERGGGARNLSVAETSYQTMISSIGWEINYVKPTDYGLLACNLYAGWEHEYMPEDSPLTASLATTPAGLARGISPGITANGAHPGTDWLGLGVNVRLLTSGGWNCSLGYYGQVLRQSASSHIGTIGFSKSF